MSSLAARIFPEQSESFAWLVERFSDSDRKSAGQTVLEVVAKSMELAKNDLESRTLQATLQHTAVAESEFDSDGPSVPMQDCPEYFAWYSSLREGLSGRPNDDPLVERFCNVVQQYRIPVQFVFDLIRGIHREASDEQFTDFDLLETCAYQRSSCVLLCLLAIAGADLKDDATMQAIIQLGIADYLVFRLANFVPQLQSKKFFLSKPEWVHRRLDLYNQSEPIEDGLWQDLIQFQCRRVQSYLHRFREYASHGRFPQQADLVSLALKLQAMQKKLRRNPLVNLREPVRLSRYDRAKLIFQRFRGMNALAATGD